MPMVSKLWATYNLYRGKLLNSQYFAYVGLTMVSEWQAQAHAHHTHEAHHGAHWCLEAKFAWNYLFWNLLSSYLM